MKKLIIFILTLFMSLGIAQAALDDTEAYYAFDNSSGSFNDSSGNGNSLTNQGTINISGVLQDARNFNGTNEWIDTSLDFSSYSNYAFNVWVALDTPATGQEIIISNNFGVSSTGDFEFKAVGPSANKMQVFLRDGTNLVLESNTTVTDNNYHMYTYVKNGNNHSIYLDGSLVDSDTSTNTINNKIPDIGRNPAGSSYLEGSLDEFAIYNRSLSQSEILELYNNGDGFNPYSISGTTITFNNPTEGQFLNSLNFTLNVSFSENTNSTYIFNNGSETTLGTNSNQSTVNLTGIEGINNITVFTNTSGVETNSSISFTIDTTPPEVSTNFTGEYNFFDIDFTQYINVSDNISLASCIIDFSNSASSNCINTAYTFDFSGNQSFNITATDTAGNSVKLVNNTILINPYATFLFEDSLSNPLDNFTLSSRSDVNGTVQYKYYNEGLNIGENTLLFEKLGFATQSINFNLTNVAPAFNQTYQVQDARILIEIRDKETSNLITGVNFTAEFIATVGLTTSTTSGVINVSNTLFLNEDYRVVISNADYQTESLFFTFSNQEILETDAYMIEKNNTNIGLVFIKVVDRFSQPIPSAQVEALQWNPVTSAYERVSSALTGSDGVGSLNVILEDKTYIFGATKDGQTAQSESEIIETFDNGKTITITLAATVSEQNYLLQNLFTQVTQSFNNVTNISTVTFEWEDLNGVEQTVCINAYRLLATTQTKTDENCITGVSGTYIQAYYINSSYSVILKGEVKLDGDLFPIKSFKFDPNDHPSIVFEDTGLSKVIIPLLFLIAIALGMFMENIYIGTLLLMLSSGFSLLLAPTLLTGGIVTFFFFIGWVILNNGVKIR